MTLLLQEWLSYKHKLTLQLIKKKKKKYTLYKIIFTERGSPNKLWAIIKDPVIKIQRIYKFLFDMKLWHIIYYMNLSDSRFNCCHGKYRVFHLARLLALEMHGYKIRSFSRERKTAFLQKIIVRPCILSNFLFSSVKVSKS